jgi:hypothetical protein
MDLVLGGPDSFHPYGYKRTKEENEHHTVCITCFSFHIAAQARSAARLDVCASPYRSSCFVFDQISDELGWVDLPMVGWRTNQSVRQLQTKMYHRELQTPATNRSRKRIFWHDQLDPFAFLSGICSNVHSIQKTFLLQCPSPTVPSTALCRGSVRWVSCHHLARGCLNTNLVSLLDSFWV